MKTIINYIANYDLYYLVRYSSHSREMEIMNTNFFFEIANLTFIKYNIFWTDSLRGMCKSTGKEAKEIRFFIKFITQVAW